MKLLKLTVGNLGNLWFILFILLSCQISPASEKNKDNEKYDWPQWRGPNRDGVSQEREILTTWLEPGPKVLWRIELGEGFSGIAIAKDRAFTLFADDEDEFIVCFDAATGKEIWRVRTDDKFHEGQGGNGPRSTPTVSGDLVFALGAKGKLFALNIKDGQVVWQRDFQEEFGAALPEWGFTPSPVVMGTLLLAEVGGTDRNGLVAFDKKTGEVAWRSETSLTGYSSPINIKINDAHQTLFLTPTALLSVSPLNGEKLWEYPWQPKYDNSICTPVFIPPDKVFIASWSVGGAMLRVNDVLENFEIEKIWEKEFEPIMNSWVLHEKHLYGFDRTTLKCVDAKTGEVKWETRGMGRGSLIYADGHFIILGEHGKLVLAEANPTKFTEKASVQILNGNCWTPPSLANGRLYLRNTKEMICLKVSKSQS